MTLGRAPRQTDLLRSTVDYCESRVAPESIYGVLHRECFTLFPDELFADLFTDVGRRSVPPMIVAVVMVLQRIEGLSDREAVDRFGFDARWKYAAGGLDFDYPGFVHTVLVDMRARLARSARPDRIFQVVLDVAGQAGLVRRRRVLDSTPISWPPWPALTPPKTTSPSSSSETPTQPDKPNPRHPLPRDDGSAADQKMITVPPNTTTGNAHGQRRRTTPTSSS